MIYTTSSISLKIYIIHQSFLIESNYGIYINEIDHTVRKTSNERLVPHAITSQTALFQHCYATESKRPTATFADLHTSRERQLSGSVPYCC